MEKALNLEIEMVEGVAHSTEVAEAAFKMAGEMTHSTEVAEGAFKMAEEEAVAVAKIITQEEGGWRSVALLSMMGPTSSQRRKL